MEHKEKHLKSSEFITDIVIGMSDGLTVPFALAAGLSGAVSSNTIIITAGIAEIVAGSIAMGLGGYLAGKTELDHYESELRKEYEEVDKIPEKEMEEVKEIFAGYGMSSASQDLIALELSKDKHKWVDFMMRFELGLEKPNPGRATNSALTIGISYAIGGLIPLTGYIFSNNPQQGLLISAIITVFCLFFFGYFKSRVTGQPVIKGALKVTFIGIIAAASAFAIAKLIA
jgi:VIT1/CCC1 family predicted Fe2+/Mn2+ transporter